MVNACLCTCTVAVSVNALMLHSRATVHRVPFVVHVATAVLTPAGSDATVRRIVPMAAMKRTVTGIHITRAGCALMVAVLLSRSVATAMPNATTTQMKKIVKVESFVSCLTVKTDFRE